MRRSGAHPCLRHADADSLQCYITCPQLCSDPLEEAQVAAAPEVESSAMDESDTSRSAGAPATAEPSDKGEKRPKSSVCFRVRGSV